MSKLRRLYKFLFPPVPSKIKLWLSSEIRELRSKEYRKAAHLAHIAEKSGVFVSANKLESLKKYPKRGEVFQFFLDKSGYSYLYELEYDLPYSHSPDPDYAFWDNGQEYYFRLVEVI